MTITTTQSTEINDFLSISTSSTDQWIDIREVDNNDQLLNEYEQLCQQHKNKNKWILMIDPEVDSLKQINPNQIDTSKVLQVNSKKVHVSIENIEKALSSGNCSAVVLCNSLLKQSQLTKPQLAQLCSSAKKGNTQCILLNQSNTLH